MNATPKLKTILTELFQKDNFINAIPTGIGIFEVVNGETTQAYMNDGFYRLMEDERGIREQRTQGQFLFSIHPDDRKDVAAAMQKVIVDGSDTVSQTCRAITGHGTYKWVRFTSSVGLRQDDYLVVYSVYVDMEEEMTRRLALEEQYYQQLDLMMQVDDTNLVAKGQFNLTKEKIVYYYASGANALDIPMDATIESTMHLARSLSLSKEACDTVCAHMNRDALLADFKAGRTEGNFSYRRQNKEGHFVFINLRYLMGRDPLTGDIMLFVYCDDNTNHQLEQIILTRLGEWEFEAIGLIDVTNGDFFQKNFNVDYIEPVIGKTIVQGPKFFETFIEYIQSQLLPDDRDNLISAMTMEHICSQLKDGTFAPLTYSICTDGTTIARKKLDFRYLDDESNIILYTCSDITTLYQQEQAQLRKSQEALRMAHRATQAKTEFLSRMSHDFRTPLNAILGTANLAKEDVDKPEAIREALNTIDSSGHFLLGLINDILDINKIESGKIDLTPEVCRVSDFANSIENTIRPLMDEHHINFKVAMNCGYDTIYVNRLRHHQIFFNLLSNAAKYTPDYGTVEFTTTRIPAPEGMAGIRTVVRDTGIGMTAEYMTHLFEPFTRDTNAEINQIEGTGLGLAIVKNIVDAMGGQIFVESILGEGTIFTVDLILPQAPESSILPDADHMTTEDLTDCRILLVEDNIINTRIAVRLLERKHCQMMTASNGQLAVERILADGLDAYDAILMDIRMPVMDGLTATREIRKLEAESNHHIPIIATTADAFSEDANRTRAAGMDAHIAKPLDPSKLYTVLAQLIQKSRG